MLKKMSLFFVSIFLLIGCGGSSSTSSSGITSTTGTFIDNIVSGVRYVNDGDTSLPAKFTDEDGEFQYDGGLVEFYIGNIKIGELTSLPEDGNVFVQDLVDGVDRTNSSDAKVLKIARLLQSLDSDPSTDEIEIEEEDFNKFDDEGEDRDLEDLDLADIFEGKEGLSLETEENAKQHLLNTMNEFAILEELDTTSPEIVDIFPENGEVNVEQDDAIYITFSEDVKKSTITSNIELKDESNNEVNLNINYISSSKLLITYSGLLDYDTTYTLTIKPNIEDFAGNKILLNGGNTDLIISFTTESEYEEEEPVEPEESEEDEVEPISDLSSYMQFNERLFDANTTLYNVYKNKVDDVWDDEFSIVTMNFSDEGIKVAEGFSDSWEHTFTDYKIMENGMLRYEDDYNKDNTSDFETTRRFIKITRSLSQHLWVCYGDDYDGVSNCSSNTDNNEYLYLTESEAKKRIYRSNSDLYGYEIFINDGDEIVNMEFWKHGTYNEIVTDQLGEGHTECTGTWEADLANDSDRIVIESSCRFGNFSVNTPSNFGSGDDVSIVDLETGSVKSREAFLVRTSIQ